ncbi:MAG: hypothetical protein ABIY70_21910 [Capsulimonas sp.]|uniref:hypothetical protein n=1 Tax=Capsulimonas sp. TaxID=2494211 RepID=UPI0032674077
MMKTKKITDNQASILARRADGSSPRPEINREVGRASWFGLRGWGLGLVLGAPLGVSLYCLALLLYFPVFFIIGALSWITPRSPHVLTDIIFDQVNFGPGCVIFLGSLCVALDVLWTRQMVRRGDRAFALAQAPLSIAVVIALFAITMIRHKPLSSFYGQ